MPKSMLEVLQFDIQPVPNRLLNAVDALLQAELGPAAQEYFDRPGDFQLTGAISTDDKLLGVSCVTFPLNYERPTVNIDYLAVQARYQRGYKIGRTLLECIEDEATSSGIGRITVSATQDAEEFYLKYNYEHIDTNASSSVFQKLLSSH